MDGLYGSLKSLVAALVMPIPITLGLALGGWLLLRWGRRRAGRLVLIGAALLLLLMSWRPVAERLLAPLENRYPALIDARGLDHVTAVVVLGGGWQPNPERPITSQLNHSSAIRLFEGLRLLRALPQARLIVSGGSRSADRPPVAQGYAQAARELGVPAERILRLDTPLDTAQEADAVRAALGTGQRFVLVTSAAHMPRAMRHFQRVGFDPIPAPTEHLTGRSHRDRLTSWLPSSGNLDKTERAWHEYLGLLAPEFLVLSFKALTH